MKKLIAIGEAIVDMTPNEKAHAIKDVEAFYPNASGAPADVSGAYARLGGPSAIITQVGDDPFGDKIIESFGGYGIDTSMICRTREAKTSLAFISLRYDGGREFDFYRKMGADMLFPPENIDPKWFKDCFALQFGSVSLGDFPMKKAHARAIELAKENGAIISFDPNLRFTLWDDRAALRKAIWDFIPGTDILKISDDELEFITASANVNIAKQMFFDRGVKVLLYTMGDQGMKAFTRTAYAEDPGRKVKVVDTTGAGDGSIGAFLYKLSDMGMTPDTLDSLTNEQLKECISFANVFCALSVQKRGTISSYPTLKEVQECGL